MGPHKGHDKFRRLPRGMGTRRPTEKLSTFAGKWLAVDASGLLHAAAHSSSSGIAMAQSAAPPRQALCVHGFVSARRVAHA
jgi:hypothetical protein